MSRNVRPALRVLLNNKQQTRRVSQAKIIRLVSELMDKVSQLDAKRPWAEVSVVLMDDDGIARINKQYLGKRGPTDVISFSYEPLPIKGQVYQGEVIVNVERAAAEARRRRCPASHELALYLAHGCQHLSGASDHTVRLKAAMRRRELTWLKDAGREGLLDGLVEERGPRRK